jgi:hypothetical protein
MAGGLCEIVYPNEHPDLQWLFADMVAVERAKRNTNQKLTRRVVEI